MIGLLLASILWGVILTGLFYISRLISMNSCRFLGLLVVFSLLFFASFFSSVWFTTPDKGELLSLEENKKILILKKGLDFREILFFVVRDEKNNPSVWYYSDIEKIKSKIEQKERREKDEKEEEKRKDRIIRRTLE